MEFPITKALDQCRCAACGSPEVAPRGKVERRFRAVPIGHRPVTVVYPIPRLACAAGGVVRPVELDFAEPRRTFTKACARYALALGRLMTIQDVAQHLGSFVWTSPQDAEKILLPKAVVFRPLASGNGDKSAACPPSRAGLAP